MNVPTDLPPEAGAAASMAGVGRAPSRRLLPVVCVLVFVAGMVVAFPPFDSPWTVFFFLVPFVLWAGTAPRWRSFFGVAAFAGWAAWFLVLIWLRHIYPPWGWVALTFLAAEAAIFPTAWLMALRWAVPRLRAQSGGRRCLAMLGLAGWWVVLDWVRGWLFTGFLWLPLAAAFWRFPVMLQPAAWTGEAGVTFLVVGVNLGVAAQLRGFRRDWKNIPAPATARAGAFLQPELGAALALLLAALVFSVREVTLAPARELQPLLRVGVVQPWTPALLKWDEASEVQNWTTLRDLTLGLRATNVEAVFWPEAAPPFLVEGPDTADARALLQRLVDATGKPLLLGAVAEAPPPPGAEQSPGDYNAMLVMNPGSGLEPEFYAKQKRVPFGEYVPGRSEFPFLGKVVPLPEDTLPGRWENTLPLRLPNGRVLQAGPLICYEDIFPALALAQARAGADFLVVVTNDAWYGEEGGALQHAAHSVLRAVETRRPVVRCGNDGWSGWIDEYGFAYALEQTSPGRFQPEPVDHDAGTTYFRGAGVLHVYHHPALAATLSFYTRHGDWFVALSALLAIAAVWVISQEPAGAPLGK